MPPDLRAPVTALDGAPAAVGIVGLGIMGSALAARLLALGHDVVGHDVRDERLLDHERAGGTAARSAGEVARRVALLVTSLPTEEALTEVLDGDGGLLMGAAPGLVVVETSTLSRTSKLDAHARCAEAGVHLLDCTLSGTGAQALTGDLVAFLSGSDTGAKRAATTVLESVIRRVVDVGDVGNGTSVKMVANLLVAVHNAAAAEAVVLAERAGLDPVTVIDAVSDGAGGSRMLSLRGPLMAEERYLPATATLTTMLKDLELIAGFARQHGSPTPLLDLTAALYRTTSELEPPEVDSAAVATALRSLPHRDQEPVS